MSAVSTLDETTVSEEATVSSVIKLVSLIRDLKISVEGAVEEPKDPRRDIRAMDRRVRRYGGYISGLPIESHRKSVGGFFDTALYACVERVFQRAQAAESFRPSDYPVVFSPKPL
jgi:hypothetical protein